MQHWSLSKYRNRSMLDFIERALWLIGAVLLLIAGSVYIRLSVHAASLNAPLSYIGASAKDMAVATGVSGSAIVVGDSSPWPQNAENYCFIGAVQAMANYAAVKNNRAILYPTQNDQGPRSGEPKDMQPGQLMYDMNTQLQPANGALPVRGEGKYRRPFVLSNIAYDYGGDPHTHTVATQFAVQKLGLDNYHYHQYVYHNDVHAATWGMSQALQKHADPVIVFVNNGLHSVLVAGVWLTADGASENARIDSVGVYNMWDQTRFGSYFSGAYYSRVAYADWTNETSHGSGSWLTRYGAGNALVPDPAIGMYQAGPGTQYPQAHHWLGNYVMLYRDNKSEPAEIAFDENNVPLTGPKQ